jgi:hypothetical protein
MIIDVSADGRLDHADYGSPGRAALSSQAGTILVLLDQHMTATPAGAWRHAGSG